MQYHGGFFYSSMPPALKTTHNRHKPEQVESPVLLVPTCFLKGIKCFLLPSKWMGGTLSAAATPAMGSLLGHCACKELHLCAEEATGKHLSRAGGQRAT